MVCGKKAEQLNKQANEKMRGKSREKDGED